MTRRPARCDAAGRRVRGMTLVELMVGVAIGLFLVAVMGSIYLGSKSTFQAQESVSRLQENGRFAIDTIGNDLRMSGFRGCLGQALATSITNTLNTPAALANNFAEPAWGSRFTGGAWTPALTAPASGLSADSNGDVLVVRRPAGGGWALTAEMTDGTSALTITATNTLNQGDVLMVADCGGAAVFQATNATPGAGGSLQHVTGVAGIAPGVSTNNLGRAYLQDAQVWRMQTIIYYLAASAREPGRRALWSYTTPVYDGNAQRVELVSGVERMAVTFGVDLNGDSATDRFQTADQVANWSQVVSARIELLLASNDSNVTSQAQPYLWAGNTVTPSDRRLRTVMTQTVSLRNTLP